MTINEIRTKVRRLTKTTTSDYADADLIVDVNAELAAIQTHILRDRGPMEFDDANYTDIPIATLSITSGNDTYKITDDEDGNKIITIHKVAYQEGDKWVDIPRKTVTEGNQDSLTETATGKPTSYYEVGNSIILSPVPDSSFTAKVWFDRELDVILTSDTTKVPGIPTAYHNLLCYRVAYNYAVDVGLPNENSIVRRLQMEEARLEQFEANRRDDEPTVISVETVSGL